MNKFSPNLIPALTHNNVPVITTEILAQLYGSEVNSIKVNHSRNQNRFVEGKHFFKIVGESVRLLRVTLSNSQNPISPKTRALILWTERGAARHAKMLETDQAWEVFEQLEDCYFNKRKQPALPALPASTPPPARKITITDEELRNLAWLYVQSRDMLKTITCLCPLLEIAEHKLAPHCITLVSEYQPVIDNVQKLLIRETQHVDLNSRQYSWWYCKHTCFSSTHFLRVPVFQPSAGTLPASGCSGIHEVARRYIPSASAL